MASSKVATTTTATTTTTTTNSDISSQQVWDSATMEMESQDNMNMNMNMSMSLQDLLTENDAVPASHSHSHSHGRGKRKIVVEEPLVVDKVTLQKQKRMIKNRESAARSRERKQAYTVELESLVTHLEEENAILLKQEADRKRRRFHQLMECLIPVEEKRKPKPMLRRVNSSQW